MDHDDPIPRLTKDLIPWLDRKIPEQSPRSPEEYIPCLMVGAKRELIEFLRWNYEQSQRGYPDE